MEHTERAATASKTTPVALVTGAASGIGKATAFRLAADGMAVGLFDRNTDMVEEIAQQIGQDGGQALVLPGDATRSDDVAGAVEKLAGRFGGLHAAICAAGFASVGSVTEMPESEWDQTIAVNLTGAFLLARHAMPHIVENQGAFVVVGSDASVRGSAGFAAYSASKHGVIGLIRSLALDYGPHGVRCNAVCPSFVNTPMADRLLNMPGSHGRDFYESRVPLGRFAEPQEVAAVITHLISQDASYTNGLTYVLDGGTTAGTFG